MSETRHFLDIDRLPLETLRGLLKRANELKAARKSGEAIHRPLTGKTLALIFDKPSTRTRVSFDVGMQELGGFTLMLTGAEMQLGRGETIADTARVLSRYIDAIMIRTLDQSVIYDMAAYGSIPVINGMTKLSHPCQVMADVMTFEERQGPIAGKTVAWVGDANNVMTSWMHAAAKFDFTFRVATPGGIRAARRVARLGREVGRTHRIRIGRQDRGCRRRLCPDRHLGVDGRRGGIQAPDRNPASVPGE